MILDYFKPDEFLDIDHNGNVVYDWLPHMSVKLLVMLDVTRHMYNRRIEISPAIGAMGRRLGQSASQHNVDRWGEVRAVDIMPDGIITREDAYSFFQLAVSVGFKGIGFYPHWSPSPGFHLDVRESNRPGKPALWGRIKKDGETLNVSIYDAMEQLP
jgi:hypothetical protein